MGYTALYGISSVLIQYRCVMDRRTHEWTELQLAHYVKRLAWLGSVDVLGLGLGLEG